MITLSARDCALIQARLNTLARLVDDLEFMGVNLVEVPVNLGAAHRNLPLGTVVHLLTIKHENPDTRWHDSNWVHSADQCSDRRCDPRRVDEYRAGAGRRGNRFAHAYRGEHILIAESNGILTLAPAQRWSGDA